jgi:hypothetical protein
MILNMVHWKQATLSHVKYVNCDNESMSTGHDVSMATASSATQFSSSAASATVSNTAQALHWKRFELSQGEFLVLANCDLL